MGGPLSGHARGIEGCRPGAKLIARMRGEVPPIAKLTGFEMTRIAADEARKEVETGPQHSNPMGTLHGGVLCDLADAAMSMAYASGLAEGKTFTTVEMKMNFLRPVWSAHLIAVGRVLRRGRQLGRLECRITTGQAKLSAFLESLQNPLHFLDFETFQPAIPLFDDSWAYQQIPFQFSLHVVGKPGAKARHHGHLSMGAKDPRKGFAEALRAVSYV